MSLGFDEHSVSIAMVFSDDLPYERSAFRTGLQAAREQDHAAAEVIVVDNRGPDVRPDFLNDRKAADRLRHAPGTYGNRAAMLNAAIEQARGEFLLLLFTDRSQVTLRRSAVRTMLMAATRSDAAIELRPGYSRSPMLQPAPFNRADLSRRLLEAGGSRPVGMLYADYERIEPGGERRDVHLLDWHEGRLRDTVDFGDAILFRTAALREIGGFDEAYDHSEWYDLRLRISEGHGVAHVANRYAGSLYSAAAPARKHNVFDYLLAGKEAQREMERALTEHLKRTGAYLEPGAHVQSVEYEPGEQERFADCIASVITPVNNRPQFIGRAIDSVQAQTVQEVEMIVVVNGGPGDPTADEVRRHMEGGDKFDPARPPVRLIVVDVNNLGLCLNSGLAAARGKYYVQLDSDDRLKPDAVEKLLAVFDADPTVGMVIGSYEVWTLNEQTGALHRNEEIPVVTHDEWTADNGRNNLLRINGAGAPRAAHIRAIREAGWFGVNDTPYCRNYGEDYDLVLRISERHTIGRVWDPIYEVIRHSGGTDHAIDEATIDRNDNAKDAMRLEALHRRRALNGV